MIGNEQREGQPYERQRRSLKRAGVVLLALGAVSLAWLLSRRPLSDGFQLTTDPGVLAFIPGFFLYRGSLRMARATASISAFWVAGGVVGGLGFLSLVPAGLIWAVLQGRDLHLLTIGLMYAGTVGVLAWVYRPTSDPSLPLTWQGGWARRRARPPWGLVVLGVLCVTPAVLNMREQWHSPQAQRAVAEAKKVTAGGYDGFFVVRCRWGDEPDVGACAEVIAYNGKEIKRVRVEWRE